MKIQIKLLGFLFVLLISGCSYFVSLEPNYGHESRIVLAIPKPVTWAIAPAVNLSGQRQVDPVLQADLLYQQLQQVKGMTVIPIDRVVPVLAAMHTDRVESAEQAVKICQALGCDGIVIPTITQWDSYYPPKMGASLQVFLTSAATTTKPSGPLFYQAVGMFDATNGTTHAELLAYAGGRYDPKSALKNKEYLVSMDRYSGFVYRKLIEGLFDQMYQVQQADTEIGAAASASGVNR